MSVLLELLVAVVSAVTGVINIASFSWASARAWPGSVKFRTGECSEWPL
jgi:hypothetical protein